MFYGYGIGLDVLKLNLLELGEGYLAWLPTSPELMTVLAHAEHSQSRGDCVLLLHHLLAVDLSVPLSCHCCTLGLHT